MAELTRKHLTYSFLIHGLSCRSCADALKRELADLSYVSNVEINYDLSTVKVTGDFEGIPAKSMEEDFNYILFEQKIRLSSLDSLC